MRPFMAATETKVIVVFADRKKVLIMGALNAPQVKFFVSKKKKTAPKNVKQIF